MSDELLEEVHRISIREIDERDGRSLRVMISSPLSRLGTERDALAKAFNEYSGLETKLFEQLADSGHPDVQESINLVDNCDIFVALFEPGNLGSQINDDRYQGQYYSEVEYKRAHERKAEGKWPLIYVFIKINSIDPTGWHKECLDKYKLAPKRFTTPDELVEMMKSDVLRTVIDIRSSRLKFLAETVRAKENDLKLANVRVEGYREQIDTLRDQFDEQRTALTEEHKRLVGAMETSHEDERKRLLNSREEDRKKLLNEQEAELLRRDNERQRERSRLEEENQRLVQEQEAEQFRHRAEADGLRKRLEERQQQAAQLISRGAIMGALPVLLLSCLLIGWFVWGGLRRAVETAGNVIASATISRPLYLSNVLGLDSMLLTAKVNLARELARGFDCADIETHKYEFQPQDSTKLFINRDSACFSYGPLLVEIEASGLQPCAYESVVRPEMWKWLSEKFGDHGLAVKEVRISGHASTESINSACETLTEEFWKDIDDSVKKNLAWDDRRIRSNAQLAYARAKSVERDLKNSLKESYPKAEVKADTVGILDAKGPNAADRKATLSVYVGRSQIAAKQ